MKTVKSNSKKQPAVTASIDIPRDQYLELIRASERPVSLQNQLRDLFAENDMVLSLSKRLQQKLFGDCEACAPVATPKTLEQWIAEATKTAKEAHTLLATLNERIEAD